MKERYSKMTEAYVSPKVDVLYISCEGLLCGSLGGDLGVSNDPFEDGGIVDLFFL